MRVASRLSSPGPVGMSIGPGAAAPTCEGQVGHCPSEMLARSPDLLELKFRLTRGGSDIVPKSASLHPGIQL